MKSLLLAGSGSPLVLRTFPQRGRLGGKVSTNGRRMRGLPFLKMQDSVRLCVYQELRKSRTLFVKMIFRISLPLIRLGLRRATFPPRGRLFCSLSALQCNKKKRHAVTEKDARVPEVPPLGECPQSGKGGSRFRRGEGVDQRETDEGITFPIKVGLGEAVR